MKVINAIEVLVVRPGWLCSSGSHDTTLRAGYVGDAGAQFSGVFFTVQIYDKSDHEIKFLHRSIIAQSVGKRKGVCQKDVHPRPCSLKGWQSGGKAFQFGCPSIVFRFLFVG